MTVQAPYRFVPLSKLIVIPEWADRVSQDVPFRDGLSGTLRITLKTDGPLCVGGEQTTASDTAPGQIHFFRTPDGRPAIPGTSLKGMLRNVVEIASFAHFRQVENQQLGVRDISESNNFYCKRMVSHKSRAGWLNFVDGEWQITPCQMRRVHQKHLIEHLAISRNDWVHAKTAQSRYELLLNKHSLAICPPVQFDPVAEDDHTLGQGQQQNLGYLVFTGQPGPSFEKVGAKKKEFIFFNPGSTVLKVDATVMSGFYFIHENSTEWKFWRKKLTSHPGAINEQGGIPVFFHQGRDGQVQSLGLAFMYKLPYTHSLHDAIGHTHQAHLDDQPDLADLIFGHLHESRSLRGRVNVGVARLVNDGRLGWTRNTVLSSPKPTFYPLYIKQTGKYKQFSQLMEPHAELAGWKRYQIKPDNVLPPSAKSTPRVQVRLETVEDAEFTFEIRLHNLRPVELGALLWALDFGGRAELRHSLGAGKPYGLGKVILSVDPARSTLRPNDPATTTRGPQQLCAAARLAYVDYMEAQVSAATHQQSNWVSSQPLQQLFEYANPKTAFDNASDFDYFGDVSCFVSLKKANKLFEIKNLHHEGIGQTAVSGIRPKPVSHYLEQAEQEIKRRELEFDKVNMSDEDRIILDIEGSWLKYQADTASKTNKDKLSSFLSSGYQQSVNMTDQQRRTLIDLAKRMQGEAKASGLDLPKQADKNLSKIINLQQQINP